VLVVGTRLLKTLLLSPSTRLLSCGMVCFIINHNFYETTTVQLGLKEVFDKTSSKFTNFSIRFSNKKVSSCGTVTEEQPLCYPT